MRSWVGACLLVVVGPSLAGCPGNPASAPSNAAVGRAVDSQGQPLADVTVDISGKTTDQGGLVSYDPKTDASGNYHWEDLAPGTYTVQAWRTVSYNGNTYRVPLAPDQGDIEQQFLSRNGIARNFTWKLSGAIPTRFFEADKAESFYGGAVTINGTDKLGNYVVLPAGTVIRGELVPAGPLMDGSTGQTLRFEFPFKQGLYLHQQLDIPLGRYTLSATAALSTGETRPLRMHQGSGGFEDSDYTPTIQVDFLPGSSPVRPYQTHFVNDPSFDTRL